MAKVSRNSTDPRVRRTRRMLREALFALLREKAFESISVRDITEHAGLNHATFYLHYDDKWDMLDSIVEEIQRALDEETPLLPPPGTDPAAFVPVIEIRLLEHIQQYWEMYRLMVVPHGTPALRGILSRHLEQLIGTIIARLLPDGDTLGIPPTLATRFFASAYVGVIEWWLESKTPALLEQMAGWLWTLETATLADVEAKR